MGVPLFAKSKTSSKGVIKSVGAPRGLTGASVWAHKPPRLVQSDLREWPGERMALPCWGFMIENQSWHLANESLGNNGVKEKRG